MDLFNLCQVNKDLIDLEIKHIISNDDLLSQHHKDLLLGLCINNGKKLRPLFTIVGSYFGEDTPKDIYKYAAIFELVHVASLIHDDVIDDAETRRGIPSIHTITDRYTAIMLGNYLVSRCAELVSDFDLEDKYYNHITLTDLCHSEIMQQKLLFNYDITINEYIEKTKNKTALLIAASFLSGATIANADQKTLGNLYRYAINLGISFQIIDDILDFTQNESTLGKPVGQDLYNGNITLPVIYALRNKKLTKKIKNLQLESNSEDFKHVVDQIIKSQAIEKSKKLNRKYIKKAKRAMKKITSPNVIYLKTILKELEKRSY